MLYCSVMLYNILVGFCGDDYCDCLFNWKWIKIYLEGDFISGEGIWVFLGVVLFVGGCWIKGW